MSSPARIWRRARREWSARRRGGLVDHLLVAALLFTAAYAASFGVFRVIRACGGF